MGKRRELIRSRFRKFKSVKSFPNAWKVFKSTLIEAQREHKPQIRMGK